MINTPQTPRTPSSRRRAVSAGSTGRVRVRGTGARGTLLLLAGLIVLALLAEGGLSVFFGLRSRAEFRTITHDSVPSIIAADQLRAAIQTVDADLANTALENGNPGPHKEDWIALRAQDSKAALDQLAQAQGNVTFAGECQDVATLRNGFVDYSTIAAQAEAQAKASGAAIGTSVPAVVALYNQAVNVLSTRLDPATVAGSQLSGIQTPSGAPQPVAPGSPLCEQGGVPSNGGLYMINLQHETSAYSSGRMVLGIGIALIALATVAALAAILITNIFVAGRTHRYVNLGLAGAAALALVLGATGMIEMSRLYSGFKMVSKDSLDSIRYALDMKGAGSAANADESRWLADPASLQKWQSDYDQQQQLVNQAIVLARDNVTYAGEKAAIDGVSSGTVGQNCQNGIQKSWNQYVQIDGQMRKLQAANNQQSHVQAVQLDLSTSNDAFNDFVNCASLLQQVNQSHYDSAASAANGRGWTLVGVGAVLGLLAIGATIWGVRPRLEEL